MDLKEEITKILIYDWGDDKLSNKEVVDKLYTLFHSHIERAERKWKEKGHVDATPDGNYALRLLQQAREDCNTEWSDNTAGIPSDNLLIVELNKLNTDRAKELDRDIEYLKKGEKENK